MASSSSSESASMKNTDTDEAAFSDRVKKTFGSLFASLEPSPPSPSSLSNPLWSLTGAEVKKSEWRRDKDTSARDSVPCSSSFDEFLSQARKNSRNNLRNYRNELEDDLRDLDDDDDDSGKRDDEGVNDWDVRSSIGLDSTLDNEEEEDTYDKVATGRENAGDRLCMKAVIDNCDLDLKSEDDIPGALGNRRRDPRANLWAAKIRLKEDDAEAEEQPKPEQKAPPPQQQPEKDSSSFGEDGEKPKKPILKRKEQETTSKDETTSKAPKRVRFDPGCLISSETTKEVSGYIPTPAKGMTQDNGSMADERVPRVPDYVLNPSKYTRYNLDSADEMNEKSNSGAFTDFLEMVKRSKNGGLGSDETDAPPLTELPKSVTFVPKRKSDTSKSESIDTETTQNNQSDTKRSSVQSSLLGLPAEEEDRDTGVGDMDVDEPETSVEPDRSSIFKKQGRQYRGKSRSDEEA